MRRNTSTILKEVYLYRIFKDIHNIALCYFASSILSLLQRKNDYQSLAVILCMDLTMNKYEVQNE